MADSRADDVTAATPRRDLLAAGLAAGWLAVTAPYLGIFVGRPPGADYRNVWAFVALGLLVVVGCLAGWRRVATAEERRFRGLVAAAFAVWVASELAAHWLAAVAPATRLAINDSSFVVVTVLLCVAALEPSERGMSRAEVQLLRLHRGEVAVFAFGVFVYLAVLPTRLQPALAASSAASGVLYVTLDLLLLGLYLWRWRRAPRLAERARWRLFALAASLFLLSDAVFLAGTIGRFEPGRWVGLDLLWYLPHLAVLAGVRRAPARARMPDAPAAAEAPRPTHELFRPPRGVQVAPGFLYAALVPVVHLAAEALGAPPHTEARGPHRFALAVTLTLVALAWVHQRRQRAVWGDLQREIASEARRRAAAVELEAVGRLAAGVAHDFNNLLTVVVGRADLIRARRDDASAQRELDDILEVSHRATALTSELLAVGQREPSRRQTLVVDAALTERQARLTATAGDAVAVTFALGAAGGRIDVDPEHLDRILDSLVAHAAAALPRGGRLEISTRRRRLAGGWTRHLDEVPEGDYLSIEVRDDGAGLSAAALECLFEPFATTRQPRQSGRGAGLGLATVRGLVRQNRGQIVVHSAPGDGTAFELLFPELA